MHKRNKRILAATLAVAGVLAVAGTAWAVFSSSTTSSNVQGGTASIAPLTVTGQLTDATLWPNQSTDVTLAVVNPNDTKLKVSAVVPVGVTNADITLAGPDQTPQAYDFCRQKVQTVGLPAPASLFIQANAGADPISIPGGLKLLNEADNRCQGMTINAKWTVEFDTAYTP